MKLSEKEKAARRAAFQAMSPAGRLEHIYTYYKWPILLGLIALLVLGSFLHRQLTRKEPVLYVSLVNLAVGSEQEEELTAGYLRAAGLDERKQEVYLYKDLYLSEDADVINHEYVYASRMKVMGAIQARQMDLVLMNREAYDLFSRSGYLLELTDLLAEGGEALEARLAPLLAENEIILSDNSVEYMLGEAETAEIVTESAVNGILASALPRLQDAGYDGEIFLGVVANCPRTDAALRYLEYLLS